jgi:N-acetyl-gamma-glutamyl-phosphate reductase
LLALAPGVRAGAFRAPVVVDAKSGLSGAGRAPSESTHLAGAEEDVVAYGLAGHRHAPEVDAVLAALHPGGNGAVGPLTMVTHRLPMSRGLLADVYVRPALGWGLERLRSLYADTYAGSPFVRLVDTPPHTKATRGSNLCLLHLAQQGEGFVLLAALDNLGKGAAGQAIQNWNLTAGWDESAGLGGPALYP